MASASGFACANADCTIVADTPRLAPHTATMAERLGSGPWRAGIGQGESGQRASAPSGRRGRHPCSPSSSDGAAAYRRPVHGQPHNAEGRRPRPQALSREFGGTRSRGGARCWSSSTWGGGACAAFFWPSEQDPSPQLDQIEALAARLRVAVRDGAPGAARRPGSNRGAAGCHRAGAPARGGVPRGSLSSGSAWQSAVPPGSCRYHRPAEPPATLADAESAGVTGVVLPSHRSARLSPTVAEDHNQCHGTSFPCRRRWGAQRTERAPRAGVWSIGLAGEPEQSLYALPLGEGPIALVVGSKEKGLAPLVRRRCDAVVSIPQHGALPSLNVGVAGAVGCFEVARRAGGSRNHAPDRTHRTPGEVRWRTEASNRGAGMGRGRDVRGRARTPRPDLEACRGGWITTRATSSSRWPHRREAADLRHDCHGDGWMPPERDRPGSGYAAATSEVQNAPARRHGDLAQAFGAVPRFRAWVLRWAAG